MAPYVKMMQRPPSVHQRSRDMQSCLAPPTRDTAVRKERTRVGRYQDIQEWLGYDRRVYDIATAISIGEATASIRRMNGTRRRAIRLRARSM